MNTSYVLASFQNMTEVDFLKHFSLRQISPTFQGFQPSNHPVKISRTRGKPANNKSIVLFQIYIHSYARSTRKWTKYDWKRFRIFQVRQIIPKWKQTLNKLLLVQISIDAYMMRNWFKRRKKKYECTRLSKYPETVRKEGVNSVIQRTRDDHRDFSRASGRPKIWKRVCLTVYVEYWKFCLVGSYPISILWYLKTSKKIASNPEAVDQSHS